MPDLDLVIVGAGAAGIGAARAAARAGLAHQVIEASHRIGGRAYTEDLAPGVPFDLGCHWLHSSDINPLVAEADRLDFAIDRTFAFSPHLWLNGRHATRTENEAYSKYFGMSESGTRIALPADRDCAVLSMLDPHSPYFAPYAHVFSVIHAADPDQVSLRDVMTQTASGGDWPVRDGLGRMMTHLGADIPVALNTVAQQVDWSARDRVAVSTNRGEIMACAVLITVSIGILQSGLIRFRPALPAATLSAIGGFSPGAANRIALYFDRDVFGGAPSNLTIVDGDAEPLAIHIPTFGFNYVVGQTGGRYASHLTRAGRQAATDYVLDRVAAVFGEGIRRHFVRSIVSAWDTDPWVLGAYASVKPGHFGARDRLAEPVDNRLFFAGEAVGMPMVATCGGAFWSGSQAIGRIVAALQPAQPYFQPLGCYFRRGPPHERDRVFLRPASASAMSLPVSKVFPMATSNNLRSGGQVLIDALKIHGVDMVFCVPGESYLAALDALHDARDRIRLVVCRQEGGAAYMAEAYGKMTGSPGICFVTRGPGATNASIGVHTAFQDSSPMILFVGQVARDQVEREAFQEIDFRRMFGPMTKWVTQIDDAARIPEYVSQAFHRATNGRPGPVVLAVPEDMLTDRVDVADAGRYRPVRPAPSAAQMSELRNRLSDAKRPFMILGGGGWSPQAVEDIRAFAEAANLPVGCSFRCQDLFDNGHPNYAGDVGIGINPKLADRVKNSDLLIVVGARLGEMTTSGYTLLDIPVPRQVLVHVHASAEELGRVYQAALPINAGMAEFASVARTLSPPSARAWDAETKAARADYLEWSTPPQVEGPVQMGEIVSWLEQRLPEDAILTNGAGNYATWIHRFHRYRRFRTQLAPTNGSMGYGVPSAVAAKLIAPERMVVSFNGDGCYMMNGQELATAVQYHLPVIFIVVNNGSYGTIRMHQERTYPGRVSGTDLVNPDFAALAAAYGAHGELVTETAQFAPAFERAAKAGKPALIEIRLSAEVITPRQTLSQIRAAALAARPRP